MKSVNELKQTKKKGCIATSVGEVYHKGFIEGIELAADEYGNEFENVVNELDLSDMTLAKHGPLGTSPSELVRLVLESKDREIAMLKGGMKKIDDLSWGYDGDCGAQAIVDSLLD